MEGQDDETSADSLRKNEPQMSKNQLKKQRKRERWLAVKQERRFQAKQKQKQRRAEKRENGEELGPSRKSLKTNRMKNSSCKVKVVVDLSLDEYMTEKDVASLTSQLQHSYSANRRAENPLQLYFCGICGKTKNRLDDIGDYKGWDIYPETKPYEEVFPKDSVVYLSSESPNILSTLSPDKVYVIGGLVDHNRHKGLCHRLAEEKGISHAQLPISEYLQMSSRKVLAVNHVFSILLRFTETEDWKTSFLSEMPQRKQAQLKEAADNNSKAGSENTMDMSKPQPHHAGSHSTNISAGDLKDSGVGGGDHVGQEETTAEAEGGEKLLIRTNSDAPDVREVCSDNSPNQDQIGQDVIS